MTNEERWVAFCEAQMKGFPSKKWKQAREIMFAGYYTKEDVDRVVDEASQANLVKAPV